jgi:hypothetical protein
MDRILSQQKEAWLSETPDAVTAQRFDYCNAKFGVLLTRFTETLYYACDFILN